MVRHIVFFRILDELSEENRSELLNTVKLKLEELPALIPQIRSFEAGINITTGPGAAHLSLMSEFDDIKALEAYQDHPAHKAFVAWNRDKCPKMAVVDYLH
ncbi:MAG: Dabb family protein [Bacteroidales bacterium]|nr:Dabb family protein [Bacteroidales bacterium]MBK9356720.1 Dabb family protein [Bacteroidales bacterium]